MQTLRPECVKRKTKQLAHVM